MGESTKEVFASVGLSIADLRQQTAPERILTFAAALRGLSSSDAAQAAGVVRMIYTSSPRADDSINPVAGEHKATEAYLTASGVPHVVLRNGWYHENYVPVLAAAAETGEILTAAGDGRVASAARRRPAR